jgi:hypothetical protein
MMELRKDIRYRFLELARKHAGSDFFEEALRELAGELLRSDVPRDTVYQELEGLRPSSRKSGAWRMPKIRFST